MPSDLAVLFSAQSLFFALFALLALGSAILMVLHPNPVRAALSLVVNLFCVAGLYLLLNAYFLAAVQVIVYAGAIMVLFLFVIMLLNLGSPDRTQDELKWQQPVAVVVGVVLALVIGVTIYTSISTVPPSSGVGQPALVAPASAPVAATPDPEAMGTVQGVGHSLYDAEMPWLFPFEITSILLLIAVVGSVVLAQRRIPTAAQEGMES